MKIEIGESLFYSWLRHVKDCQIVQNNWKVSSQWNLSHTDELEQIALSCEKFFSKQHGYENIFKGNSGISQIIRQGECDALGLSMHDNTIDIYAVDVAFHEAGINYGDRNTTVKKILEKCIRTAMCIVGYLDTTKAEIIFASPKVNPAIRKDLSPVFDSLNKLFSELGYEFTFRLICNEEFLSSVLKPILLISEGIADTSELFMRSYQLFSMFSKDNQPTEQSSAKSLQSKEPISHELSEKTILAYREMKIGRLAQTVLRSILESGTVSESEIELLQTSEHSKKVFDLQYPLLVKVSADYNKVRYYTKPLRIHGCDYVMCSQWFETPANNDRPYLLKWIESHS